MADGAERRAEMGAFLRARREQMPREAHGLPVLPRGRTTGLRREEVSYLCGVSVTWYTWLEQGRPITPSRHVLDAIASTLQLSAPEHRYLLELGGYSPQRPGPEHRAESVPEHLQRLLDDISHPAYALAADWSIAAWNIAYAALYPTIAHTDTENRNLLWLVFTDPSVRELLDDWDLTSSRFLAEFRAETAARIGDSRITSLVDRLRTISPEFRWAWDGHPVAGFQSRERIFHHPTAGRVRLEHHQLRPTDRPELQLIVYTPLDEHSRRRLVNARPADSAIE
jgi:transcriptional regulator with XRE-family HTH domain